MCPGLSLCFQPELPSEEPVFPSSGPFASALTTLLLECWSVHSCSWAVHQMGDSSDFKLTFFCYVTSKPDQFLIFRQENKIATRMCKCKWCYFLLPTLFREAGQVKVDVLLLFLAELWILDMFSTVYWGESYFNELNIKLNARPRSTYFKLVNDRALEALHALKRNHHGEEEMK